MGYRRREIHVPDPQVILEQLKRSGVGFVRTSLRPGDKNMTLAKNLQSDRIGLVLVTGAEFYPNTPLRPADERRDSIYRRGAVMEAGRQGSVRAILRPGRAPRRSRLSTFSQLAAMEISGPRLVTHFIGAVVYPARTRLTSPMRPCAGSDDP